jgi:hypothetical protein
VSPEDLRRRQVHHDAGNPRLDCRRQEHRADRRAARVRACSSRLATKLSSERAVALLTWQTIPFTEVAVHHAFDDAGILDQGRIRLLGKVS